MELIFKAKSHHKLNSKIVKIIIEATHRNALDILYKHQESYKEYIKSRIQANEQKMLVKIILHSRIMSNIQRNMDKKKSFLYVTKCEYSITINVGQL